MKRIIAVSDSHGDTENLRAAFLQARRHGTIDVAVFLGDGAADFEAVRPILMAEGTQCHAVRGNNDWGTQAPGEVCLMVNGVRFYCCHGHGLGVKYGLQRLWYAAQEREAKVALYGHTHCEHIALERDMQLINPGAVCERGRKRSAYAEIVVEDNGHIRPRLCPWE